MEKEMKIIYEGKEAMFGDKFGVYISEDIWLKCGETASEPIITLSSETALAMAKAIIKELEVNK